MIVATGRSRHTAYVWSMTLVQNILLLDVVLIYLNTKRKHRLKTPVTIGYVKGDEEV